MALRRPSQKTIDIYNQLVEQQNKVRRLLRKIHKNAEEAFGVGRLPSLVTPKSAKKVRMSNFKGFSKDKLRAKLRMFWNRYKEAKALFAKGLKSYIARTIKQGYLDLYKDQILYMSGEDVKGAFGYYSKQQIEGSYMGEYMILYNSLLRLSPEVFLALLYTGRIIQFKYIYQDMINGTGSKENSWLQQQFELLKVTDKTELLEFSANLQKGEVTAIYGSEGTAYSYGGKHTSETMKEAKEKAGRARK